MCVPALPTVCVLSLVFPSMPGSADELRDIFPPGSIAETASTKVGKHDSKLSRVMAKESHAAMDKEARFAGGEHARAQRKCGDKP